MSTEHHKIAAISSSPARHRRVALWASAIALVMLAMAYAAVPLYQMFCQVTGFAGTTRRADQAPGKVLDRAITIRFDSNVAGGLAWRFEPLAATMSVKIGENKLAFYRVTNPTDQPLTGSATFNVAPAAAGRHFSKIACFCFKEQTLNAGESVDMPVSFFVDPDIVDDPDARHLTQITLSYTFYPVDKKQADANETKNGKLGSRG